MQQNKATGKRLFKNTVLMYIRMAFLLAINFYTSRVILQELGIEDFGIYNVVASIIIMFSSLKMLIASSTQRFLNYEMGKGNQRKLIKIYNTSIYINSIIAIIFLLIVELVGMCFFYYKININPARFDAAMVVFQCSIVGSLFSIFSTTYDAEIIAHERMGFYAYISILDAILKLAAVFLLNITPFDKLAFYGVLLLVISMLSLVFNALYSIKNFEECKFKKTWDRELIKEMSLFASWNFVGKSSYAISQSGLNMVLNIFGGPIVNAARGIAFQLNSATNQFVNNVNIVLDPFFIKTYAEGNMTRFYTAFNLSSKALFFVQLIIVIPFYFLSEILIKIWLGQIPDYSIGFLRLILIWSLIRAPHSPIDKLFKAVGDIKLYQILEGFILLIPIISSYLCLKIGCSYNIVFINLIIFEAINLMAISVLAIKICNFSFIKYIINVISPCCLTCIPFAISTLFNFDSFTNINKIILTIVIEALTFALFYLCLNNKERILLHKNIKINN